MTTIYSLLSLAISVRTLRYLSIELLIKFLMAFDQLIGVFLKRERFVRLSSPYRSSVHLSEVGRVFYQVEWGEANPNSNLQNVWRNQRDFQLGFLLQQSIAAE